jgi:hypothetical protein
LAQEITMKHLRWLAVVAVVVVTGCVAQWTVDRYEAPEANLAARRTYFLKGGELGAPTAPEHGVADRIDAAVRSTITAELGRKGYVEAAPVATADMIVSYQVAGSSKFVSSDERRIGAPDPNTVLSPSEIQPAPLSTLPREQAVRDGSVIVFVDDPASGKLIWRGLVTSQTRVGSTEDLVHLVEEMTRSILGKFPARPGQASK